MGGLVGAQAQHLGLRAQAHFGRVKAQVLLEHARLRKLRSSVNHALAQTLGVSKVKLDFNFLVHARSASTF